MKKIFSLISLLLVLSTYLSASNTSAIFKTGKTQTGGVIDNQIIFLYNKEIKVEKDFGTGVLVNTLKKSICSAKDTRSLIVDSGMSVMYIYMGKEKYVSIKIDDCRGVDLVVAKK